MPSFARIKQRILINSSRVYLERYNRAFAAEVPPGSVVLDAGAGDAPYKHLFAHTNYESADFEQVDKEYAKSTYVCDLCKNIPVQDARFDFIIFNQTLEHLNEPARALSELYRVLKPGGKMLCTVPLFYEEHEQPYDFYRYTQFAHKYMFARAGFNVERIEWLEGFLGTCGYMLQTIHFNLPVRGSLAAPLLLALKFLALPMAGILYRLDTTWKVTDRGFPKNYVIVASK